jgi:adenylate cyclase class 2
MVETEVKIRVPDLAAVKQKLLTMGAVVTQPRHLEENILYDDDEGRLRSRHCALRLRAAGRTSVLTFKGARQKARSFKVREEFETVVKDRGQTKKILRALGFKPSFSYAKHRTVLRKGKLTVTLDETAAGTFIELEGERHEITRLARSLGYGRADFITASYVDMIRDARKE